MHKKRFTELLMKWHYADNARQMPWKGEKNPYKVWLSEVILQQTRVNYGCGYYEKFIAAYPAIFSLAIAKDEDVMKLWEGLGYYSRCRNLLYTARYLVQHHDGTFPSEYNSLLKLKGIGTYTAAAIASFCFNRPHAVLDGNVYRVLSRINGITEPINTIEGKKIFTSLANRLIRNTDPAAFNQSIMDFGATICKPVPDCNICIMQKICNAYKTGRVNILPVKEKSGKKKLRWFTYFIFKVDDKTLVFKRTEKDIWQSLHQFYLIESAKKPAWNINSVNIFLKKKFNIKALDIKIIQAKPQQLTHQLIKGYFIQAELSLVPQKFSDMDCQWLTFIQMQKLAFPKFIHQFFSKDFF